MVQSCPSWLATLAQVVPFCRLDEVWAGAGFVRDGSILPLLASHTGNNVINWSDDSHRGDPESIGQKGLQKALELASVVPQPALVLKRSLQSGTYLHFMHFTCYASALGHRLRNIKRNLSDSLFACTSGILFLTLVCVCYLSGRTW